MSDVEKKTWHLVQNDKGMDVTEFELLLWRGFSGFLRWQEECERATNSNKLTGHELSVLHVIRMREKPKTANDIARLLNREDMYNIRYCIKKLLKLGLIEKSHGTLKKGATYQITEDGIKNTNTFAKAREDILIALFQKEQHINLPEVSRELTKIIELYNNAERMTATYKRALT
jgi:predicted MarR family transcription regulator